MQENTQTEQTEQPAPPVKKRRERQPPSPKTLARKAERQGNVQRLEVERDNRGKKVPYVNHNKRAKREAELKANKKK